MKKLNLTLLISTMVFSGVLIYLTSCQKQQEISNSNSIVSEQSQDVTQHILDFKQRMEYFRQNSNVKSSTQSYTADSAVIELESLLNFNFCYTNIECNKKTLETTEVIMPLDVLERINDPKLMQVYYDKLIDTIQAQMGRINYTNMKLLLVDLENSGFDSNGDAIISVSSLIGNQQNVVLHNGSWVYGENLGLCGSGAYAPEDAASQLEARVTNSVLPDPPSGGRWYFTHPGDTYIEPTLNPLTSTPNNYRDYKIYYATDAVTPIIDDDTKCLLSGDMDFYEYFYIVFAEDFEILTNKKFSVCDIDGIPNWDNSIYSIQHDYTIYVGNRFVVYDAGCEDIMEVD